MAYLKHVSPSLLSHDCFRPDIQPTQTQTPLGLYLVCGSEPKDRSYGVHFTEYSGIGDLEIMGLSQRNEPTVPRTHRHFGDGSMASSRLSKIPLDVLARDADRNKAWWVEKPGVNAAYLHSLHDKYMAKPEVDLYFSTKSKFTFFPRSRKFDMEYIKDSEKIEEEAKPQISEEYDTCEDREEDSGDADLATGDIQPETSAKEKDTEDTSADVGKDEAEAEQDQISGKKPCTCEKKEEEVEKEEEPPCPQPPEESIAECRNRIRREEMFRVGRPFMHGKCAWFNELYITDKLPRVGRTDKKQYPYRHFSNL